MEHEATRHEVEAVVRELDGLDQSDRKSLTSAAPSRRRKERRTNQLYSGHAF
jgi:hypothetical protein